MDAYRSHFGEMLCISTTDRAAVVGSRVQKCLLLDFPNLKLSGVIIAEWITIWDLGRLDSAVCNHQRDLRKKYLKIFGPTSLMSMTSSVCNVTRVVAGQGIVEENRRIIHSADCFRFMIKRNIAITTCALAIFLERAVLHDYLRQFGAKLQVLEFCGHVGNVDSWQLYYDLFQYCPRLQAVLFHANSSTLCPQDVLEITQHCPLLRRLQVQNAFHLAVPRNIRPYDKVQPSLSVAPLMQLRSFVLHSFSKSTLALTTALATQCPALISVDLTGCTGLNDAALLKLGTGAVFTLSELNLNQCSKLTSTGMVAFLNGNGAKNAAFTALHLSKTECTNDVLNVLAAQCRMLTTLDIRQCRHFTDAGITALAQGCTALTQLWLTNSDTITDDCVELLSLHCPLLHTLCLHSCAKLTDAAVQHISTRCANLRTLDIGGRSQISEPAFIAALQEPLAITPFTAGSQGGDASSNHSNTSPGGSANNSIICTFGSALTELNVSDRASLGDASLRAIAAHCVNLVSLNVSGLKRISDDSVVAVARALSPSSHSLIRATLAVTGGTERRGLRELQLNELYYITDIAIQAVAELLGASLTLLSISECERLTDASCLAVAQHCRHLQSLCVSGIDGVTDLSGKELFSELFLLWGCNGCAAKQNGNGWSSFCHKTCTALLFRSPCSVLGAAQNVLTTEMLFSGFCSPQSTR
jgi:hypothetical protein